MSQWDALHLHSGTYIGFQRTNRLNSFRNNTFDTCNQDHTTSTHPHIPTQYRFTSTSFILLIKTPAHVSTPSSPGRIARHHVQGAANVCIAPHRKKNFRDSCVHEVCVSLNFLNLRRIDRNISAGESGTKTKETFLAGD